MAAAWPNTTAGPAGAGLRRHQQCHCCRLQQDFGVVSSYRGSSRALLVIMADAKPLFLEILDGKNVPGTTNSVNTLRHKLREGAGFSKIEDDGNSLEGTVASGRRMQGFIRGRKLFQQGILGGGLSRNSENWEPTSIDVTDPVENAQAFNPSLEAENEEDYQSDSSSDCEVAQGEDLLAGFFNSRKNSKKAQDWRGMRRQRRAAREHSPNAYEVESFPHKPSDLRTETKAPIIKGPVYGGVVKKAFELMKNLQVNQRLEDVLDSLGYEMDSENGNLLMKALGERGHDSQALSCFQWMRTHEPCLLDAESYPVVFSLLGAAELPEEALILFNSMPEAPVFHSINVYNVLLRTLASCGRRDELEGVIEKMQRKGVEPDSVTFSILITYAQKGRHDLKDVWNLFQSMTKKGLKPSVPVYGNMIKGLCDEGRRTEALLVASEMEKSGMSLSVVIYNTLIDAYGKAGEMSEAEGLFEEMKQKGFHPNLPTYNILVSAYGRLGQHEVAELLLKQMEKQGIKPDVVTYSALISAYGKQKMSDQAANAFLKMRKNGIEPNGYAYTSLIHAYCEARWHDKAAITFENMKRDGIAPTVETYTALLNGYKQAGDIEKVKSVWKEMRQNGCGGTRITFNVLVDTFCKHGFYVDARAVIFEFKKLGIKPDLMTYNMLINAYARAGEHERATQILVEIRKAGLHPDAYTYSTIVYAFLRVRDYTNAIKYHDKMWKTGKLPDEAAYAKLRRLIDEQVQKRQDDNAKASLGQLEKMLSGGERRKTKKRFWKTRY